MNSVRGQTVRCPGEKGVLAVTFCRAVKEYARSSMYIADTDRIRSFPRVQM